MVVLYLLDSIKDDLSTQLAPLISDILRKERRQYFHVFFEIQFNVSKFGIHALTLLLRTFGVILKLLGLFCNAKSMYERLEKGVSIPI